MLKLTKYLDVYVNVNYYCGSGFAPEPVVMAKNYTISELAREFGVTPRTIRFYEGKGLVHPSRNGQSRVYAQRDRARLRLILRGKRVGFSLAEIGDMLDLYDLGDNRIGQLRITLGKCRDRISLLEGQQDDIDATINELAGYCRAIEDMLADKEGAGERAEAS